MGNEVWSEVRGNAYWDGIKEGIKLMVPFLAGLGIKQWFSDHQPAIMWTSALGVAIAIAFYDQWKPTRKPLSVNREQHRGLQITKATWRCVEDRDIFNEVTATTNSLIREAKSVTVNPDIRVLGDPCNKHRPYIGGHHKNLELTYTFQGSRLLSEYDPAHTLSVLETWESTGTPAALTAARVGSLPKMHQLPDTAVARKTSSTFDALRTAHKLVVKMIYETPGIKRLDAHVGNLGFPMPRAASLVRDVLNTNLAHWDGGGGVVPNQAVEPIVRSLLETEAPLPSPEAVKDIIQEITEAVTVSRNAEHNTELESMRTAHSKELGEAEDRYRVMTEATRHENVVLKQELGFLEAKFAEKLHTETQKIVDRYEEDIATREAGVKKLLAQEAEYLLDYIDRIEVWTNADKGENRPSLLYPLKGDNFGDDRCKWSGLHVELLKWVTAYERFVMMCQRAGVGDKLPRLGAAVVIKKVQRVLEDAKNGLFPIDPLDHVSA